MLIRGEVIEAGGRSAVIPFACRYHDGERVWASPTSANVFETLSTWSGAHFAIIGFELYADATVMIKNGAQSVRVVRIRLFSAAGRSQT